ncbi:MAG: response regulator, partial [Verrucomicrobiota bacterium]
NCLEPFYSTKGDRGTGLGLSMVFGIVKRHQGGIDFETEMGKGTTFFLRFPPVEEMGSAASEPSPKADGEQRPLRVLAVDDDVMIRTLMKKMLLRQGHTPVISEDGEQALQMLQEDSAFDVVITDKAMPGMSGDQLAEAVKDVMPEMPVILLTGFGQFMDRAALPAIDVLAAKPISMDSLRDALAEAIAGEEMTGVTLAG